MKIEIVNNIEMLEQAFLIRKKVFVNEQKVPFEEEIDQFEDVSIHFLVFDDHNKPIATSRMRKVEDIVKIERVCILQEYRKLGIGKKLMEFMEKVAIKNQFKVISLYAQIQALNFYKNLGYKVCSEIFLDAGIKHCKMEKKIYGLLPTCTCGGNNETEWIQQCFSNWTAMSCIYSKFERKQMY